MIDWHSSASHLFLNPRMPAEERVRLEWLYASVPVLPGHVWLATSGTTGALRLVALSKDAILASASAVNTHLGGRAADSWCCVLPTFHIGGLAIYARAMLSGSRVIALDWDPQRFAAGGFTLSSLVPAQVSDLVEHDLRAPREVRAIVVGGGHLSATLYEAATARGWPLLPSYGLTEAASQVATATPGSPELRVLPHVEVRTEEGLIQLRGPSLLTGYATFGVDEVAVFVDPKIEGWFSSGDRGEVENGVLRVFGRGEDFVKIGGESVDLGRLDSVLDSITGDLDAALVAVPDQRLGHVVQLATTAQDASAVVAAFNARVLPFERIRAVCRVRSIPRSRLGKLRRSELAELIGETASQIVE